jgi:hypothetical protein
MISNWELWACANEVLRQYGAGAASHAAERRAALEAAGDEDGRRTWVAIGDRLDELGRTVAAPGELQ